MQIQQSNLDEIKTIEEAKQQISFLMETQKNAYSFVHLLSFLIKERLIQITGFAELMTNKESVEDHPLFLENITSAAQKIHRLINTIGPTALRERIKYDSQEGSQQPIKPEALDLKPFLSKATSQIQEFANQENASLYRFSQSDLILSSPPPIETRFNIDDDLPTVKFDIAVLERIVSDIISFITEPGIISELSIDTMFDEEAVKVVFSCSTPAPHTYIMDDFHQFAAATTIFEFDPRSLALYNDWLLLKEYDGMLMIEIQDIKASQQTSIVNATIGLKRWY